MDAVTDPRLQHYPVNVQDYSSFSHPSNVHPNDAYQPSYPLNMHDGSTNASPLRNPSHPSAGPQGSPSGRVQTRASQSGASVNSRTGSMTQRSPNTPTTSMQHNTMSFKNSSAPYSNGGSPSVNMQQEPSAQTQYMGGGHLSAPDTPYHVGSGIGHLSPPATPIDSTPNPHSSTFPLIIDPPDLDLWRHRLFNIVEPLSLTEEQYLTYFPHVDNVYSHRSTQKYKRKPFVSHYWDCRLKGRPSGTPKSNDPNKKKRKRQARERDLCDVKIKVTEYFSADEVRRLGLNLSGNGDGGADGRVDGEDMDDMSHQHGLTIVMEDGSHAGHDPSSAFGMLEPAKRYPKGHPGAEGKRWFLIQRVNGSQNSGGNADEEDEDSKDSANLDHKHTMEESDRIKKNSVQRWLLKEEKERKAKRLKSGNAGGTAALNSPALTAVSSGSSSYLASGQASKTAKAHLAPSTSELTFFANSYCPFAQRIWIALEIKGIPYQYVEVFPAHLGHPYPPEMLAVNPDGVVPCLRHGNWAIWESNIMMEYLEDLSMGHSLLPLGNPQLRAHCRLWADHINRKILPAFYALLLSPTQKPTDDQQTNTNSSNPSNNMGLNEQQSMLVTTLQNAITSLVNASHAQGPFFLGSEISFVDVAFAPWIIRLSRVLSYYRNFPRPEVGTRWQMWVEAIEADERVSRTVSDENSYHNIYSGVGEDGWDGTPTMGSKKVMVEMALAKRIVGQEGFGLGGDFWGRLPGVDGNI